MIPILSMWVIVLEIMTGQVVLLPSGTEQECKQALKDIEAGDDYVVRLDNGLVLPIRRGVECLSAEDAARRQGKT